MKKMLLLFFVSIVLYPALVFADNLIGPKIYGLQLGMPVEDAKPIMEEICNKHSYSKCGEMGGVDSHALLPKDRNIRLWGSGLMVNMYYKNNTLVGYEIPLSVFNYTKATDKNVFLQELADHYDLSLTCVKDGVWMDKNPEKGYLVYVSFAVPNIGVLAIQKPEPLQFK